MSHMLLMVLPTLRVSVSVPIVTYVLLFSQFDNTKTIPSLHFGPKNRYQKSQNNPNPM